jgi:GxxExxY protein
MDLDAVNRCSGQVIDSAMRVHTLLGPGLLESVYERCLRAEIRKRGMEVLHQVPISINYEGTTINSAFRADLVVDGLVMVELKAVEKLMPVFSTQLLSYLRLSGYPLGLLINFHEHHLRNGIKRLANLY